MALLRETNITSFSWNISFRDRKLLNVFWNHGECFGSKFFQTKDKTWWQMALFPLGDAPFKSEVVVRLCRQSTDKNLHIEGEIILTSTSAKEMRFRVLKSLSKTETYIRLPLFRTISEMKRHFNPLRDLFIKCKISAIEIFNENSDSKSTQSSESENSLIYVADDPFKSSATGKKVESEELCSEQSSYLKLENVEVAEKTIVNTVEVAEKTIVNTVEVAGKTNVNNMLFCDVTLTSGDVSIKVHKNVLSKQSPTFAQIFQSSANEKCSKEIICDLISGSTLTEIVNYIYTGQLIDLTLELAKDLYHAASLFALNELQFYCEEFLIANLSLHNVVDIVTWCIDLNADKIKQHAIRFISSNFEEIKSTPNWNNFVKNHPSLCVEILSQAMEDSLMIKNNTF